MRNNYNTACHNGEIMQGLIIHPCAIMLVSPLPIVARGSRALVALYHNTIQWPSCVTRQLYSMTLYREACPCPRGHNYVRLHTFRPLCQKVEDTRAQADRGLPLGNRALRFIGWLFGVYSKKNVQRRSGKKFYQNCVEQVDHETFFEVCALPDTFQSWFLVSQLHVWLCLVRLKREKEGKHMLKEVVNTFWFDVDHRMQELGVKSSYEMNKNKKEFVKEFHGLILAYEEGLLSNDKKLGAAVWRNLIHDKESTRAPSRVATMVAYIRRMAKLMDALDSKQLLTDGKMELPTLASFGLVQEQKQAEITQ